MFNFSLETSSSSSSSSSSYYSPSSKATEEAVADIAPSKLVSSSSSYSSTSFKAAEMALADIASSKLATVTPPHHTPSLCCEVMVRVRVSGYFVKGAIVQPNLPPGAVTKCAATTDEKPPLVPAPAIPAGAFPAVSLSPDARHVSFFIFLLFCRRV